MLIDETLVRKVIQPRPKISHKGTFGRVLLIGGLYPYGGAVIMAALATVQSGAGLVTVATDKENIAALHSHLPEAMAFDVREVGLLKEQMAGADLVLIGPGLGEAALAGQILDLVLDKIQAHQILVLDGSALNILVRRKINNWPTEKLILTPHQKEWERLSTISISEQNEENTQVALTKFPVRTVLVAKSHATKIYQGQLVGNLQLGGPHQATGGMGDTLAGMIAGFLVQFQDNLFESTSAATYLHSAIADDLANEAYVVLPTAISREIPRWMKKFSTKRVLQ